jgi:hypothetical protein
MVVPGTLASLLLAGVLVGRVVRLLTVRPFVAWLLIASLGGIASFTLSPHFERLDPAPTVFCDMRFTGFTALSQLLTTNDRGLNVDLFIPLGLAIALFPNSRLKTFALALAFILPVAIETSQAVITALNRACQLQDVVDNLSGLTIGVLIGSIALVVAERAGFNPRPLGQTE